MDLGGNKNSIRLSQKGKTFLVCHPHHEGNMLYGVNLDDYTKEVALKSNHVYKVDKHIMHQRFMHPSKDVLCKARRHTVDFPNVDLQSPMPHLCDGCEHGKMTQHSFPPNDTHALRPFEVIHSDLKTYPINSIHNYKYVMTFFDDHSSHTWHTFLKTKKGAFNAAKRFIEMVKVQFKTDMEKWRCNWGGEYVLHAFKDMLKHKDIILEPSPPHMTQINGHTERFMCTFLEKPEAMHLHACIPPLWWEFAVEHSIHVYNCTPLAQHNWKTSYEIIYKEKPLVKHLHIFRSSAYVFIPEEHHKKKLQPKAKLMTYAGSRGVPLFFGCSRPRARALVTHYGLVFVFGHLGHHKLVLDFLIFGLRCCRIGSACSGLHSHGNLIIARTRSTELCRSSTASPYVLTIASSCSTDSGLTQPPAAAYASHLTHAVCPPIYLSAPGLASCSSVRPLGHWDR
jgi:hypothetical protein